MRVAIEAIDFTSFGGGQNVVAEFVKILQDFKHDVIIFSNLKFNEGDRKKIRNMWNIGNFKDVHVPNLKNVSLNSLLFNLYLKFNKIDGYISAGWLLLSKKNARRIPSFRFAFAPHSPFLFKKFRSLVAKSRIFYYLLRMAEAFFNSILDTSGEHATKRYAQSKFIQGLYKKFYDVDYDLLYSPVYQDDLYVEEEKDDKSIVCVGRIDPEKNYEKVVTLARKYPNLNFTIIGGYSPSRENNIVVKHLLNSARECNNLKINLNVSRVELIKEMNKSRFLLHLMLKEHFGIVIVEAMRCGLTPIVPMGSGPDEIVNYGEFGNNYENFHDLISNFEKYLKGKPVKSQVERAKTFRGEDFKEKASR
ncbi:MAG: glycosyltransferase, partial [Candidatus Hodarchaeota archaeon]